MIVRQCNGDSRTLLVSSTLPPAGRQTVLGKTGGCMGSPRIQSWSCLIIASSCCWAAISKACCACRPGHLHLSCRRGIRRKQESSGESERCSDADTRAPCFPFRVVACFFSFPFPSHFFSHSPWARARGVATKLISLSLGGAKDVTGAYCPSLPHCQRGSDMLTPGLR
jgi:hypothetical protein